MNIENLESKIKSLVSPLDEDTFIYDLLLAFGQPKATITRLQKGDYNLSKNSTEIIWRKKLFFSKVIQRDLHSVIDELRNDPSVLKHHPRFIILTDFTTLLAVDTKTNDTLDIPIIEIAKHFDFFLPWAGMEKMQFQSENPADIKAAERMGRLYDLILEDNGTLNQTPLGKHAFNIFLSRLLFCFFAEDTGIFSNDQFTNGIASHTEIDGSDLKPYLEKLFRVLNLEQRSEFPRYLQAFPFVNGGLFAEDFPIPSLSLKSRKIIIECGSLDWSAINPDIFGSMMQAVVHHNERATLGMHYTSTINIMKVIEPLLLNELQAALENAKGNEKKLTNLLARVYHLRIFDPACGSGNFLIIIYKELCKLEIEIFRQLQLIDPKWKTAKSGIRLSQFYGIELDDFAHETAMLSLWLAEHQMNIAFREVFGEAKPTLPLKEGGQIFCGNATRLDWEAVCPKAEGDEVFILGNPPYLGYGSQSKEQQDDIRGVLKHTQEIKYIDYITCWFLKAARYVDENSEFAFVTTNSICQGAQVSIVWPEILAQGLEISFAHKSFPWTNNARHNAGVICSIVGVRKISQKPKYFYDGLSRSKVANISPYLIPGSSTIISRRQSPLSKLPKISQGNAARDGGNLILSKDERLEILSAHPSAVNLIKELTGSKEFIRGEIRYCLWIEDDQLELARSIPPIWTRVEKVRAMRLSAGKIAHAYADVPHKFYMTNRAKKLQIVIPRVSSIRREYIPIGYLGPEAIVSDSAQVIFDPEPWVFGLINSRIHMTWVRAVSGRLKSDFRYSAVVCYNTFPVPSLSDKQIEQIELSALEILDSRECFSERTIAQLYDPEKMPERLREAHRALDKVVENCYRSEPFKNDDDRLQYLFSLYEKLAEADKRK